MVEVHAALHVGADGNHVPGGCETVVAIETAQDLGSVQSQRDALGVAQLGAAELERAGDADIYQPHFALGAKTLSVEIVADCHRVAVERDLRLAVGRDAGAIQPNGAVYAGTGHGDGARGFEITIASHAAVHDQMIRGQRELLVLPVVQVSSAQPDIAMEVSAGEMHRPGRPDLVEPKITVDLQVRRVDSREPGAVEDQPAEPGFGQDDGLVEDAVAQGDGLLDPRVAQVERTGDLGPVEREALVMPRGGRAPRIAAITSARTTAPRAAARPLRPAFPLGRRSICWPARKALQSFFSVRLDADCRRKNSGWPLTRSSEES